MTPFPKAQPWRCFSADDQSDQGHAGPLAVFLEQHLGRNWQQQQSGLDEGVVVKQQRGLAARKNMGNVEFVAFFSLHLRLTVAFEFRDFPSMVMKHFHVLHCFCLRNLTCAFHVTHCLKTAQIEIMRMLDASTCLEIWIFAACTGEKHAQNNSEQILHVYLHSF